MTPPTLKQILDSAEGDYRHPSFGLDDLLIMLREAYEAGITAHLTAERKRPMPDLTTTWTRYIGYWCDNCRTVWSFRPESGTCKDCGPVTLRPANVTVDLTDVPDGRALREWEGR